MQHFNATNLFKHVGFALQKQLTIYQRETFNDDKFACELSLDKLFNIGILQSCLISRGVRTCPELTKARKVILQDYVYVTLVSDADQSFQAHKRN